MNYEPYQADEPADTSSSQNTQVQAAVLAVTENLKNTTVLFNFDRD